MAPIIGNGIIQPEQTYIKVDLRTGKVLVGEVRTRRVYCCYTVLVVVGSHNLTGCEIGATTIYFGKHRHSADYRTGRGYRTPVRKKRQF